MRFRLSRIVCSHAALCALALLICVCVAHPVAEMGMNDDWSYIFTARKLAETGHIAYNGWASPILGWQLYLGALFIKVIGFSYTVARIPVFLIGMALAALLQRLLRRMGISEWNATVGTLSIVLSPLFLALAFSFMTDIPGLFCILLCLYSCMRALQSPDRRTALRWLTFAAVSNVVGGTVRQIAWLGVLVLVPITAWLLRRYRGAMMLGASLWVAGVAAIVGCMAWFSRQPFSAPEKLLSEPFAARDITLVIVQLVEIGMSLSLFALPLLAAFALHFPFRRRWATAGLGAFVLALMVWGGRHIYLHTLDPWWLAPNLPNLVTPRGLVDIREIEGSRPESLSNGVRIFLTAVCNIVAFSFLLSLFFTRRQTTRETLGPNLPWRSLLLLTFPITAAYILFLMPRGMHLGVFDRYLFPVLALLLGPLLRFYQERVDEKLPLLSVALVMILAAFGVAGLHDVFATDRARLAAINEMRSAGVSRTQIRGGVDYDGWTQIEVAGHVNDPRLINPPGAYKVPKFDGRYGPCPYWFANYTPAIVPDYVLSYNPTLCSGESSFGSIEFSTWLPPHRRMIYIVKAR